MSSNVLSDRCLHMLVFVGNNYDVYNYGVGGATAQDFGDIPYIGTKHYRAALDSHPDIVIIQFGTNDSKEGYWNRDRFISEYARMIEQFKSLPSHPIMFVSVPPPLYVSNFYNMSMTVVNEALPPAVKEVATITNATLIDLFTLLGGSQLSRNDYFIDGCHPNDAGNRLVAHKVACTVIQMTANNTNHIDNVNAARIDALVQHVHLRKRHEFSSRPQAALLKDVGELKCRSRM
jgi:acyl-CoA thioesterase-1